ncbi:Stk1 family PASTA domain-containing Ser/Thr kinase [Goodfellowiella coeruleoviolacea]|uniref:non-specific serine/threonine protein kinase n=1 Tax=Goodfellowiella coeruleoviolacea TaxID=334858 RepID=A0AAE3GKE2_9PSEU|nr:Stk1 family PASTA domain-containing Ser/Thr kinase [Goodfellowiella coeruleoviolacea]MCP2168989.1 serine/threonine protein kinase [Goodfellowiella coeruleoviolacea]
MSTPRLLSNRYELGDTLGYGGMSEVHGGRDVRLSRDVAVKVLRADLARDPQFQERFRREAQNAAALNHPAIVAVYDTGETQTEYGPLPYIVMEYVDGRTLRDIVKSQGPLPGKRAMEVMADVCAALDFSHRHGIVHRDVKPANIMITKTGAVKVMDFGIARAVADGQAAVTQTAAVIGTAQYLSPEQARGEAVDARSDVYAAGCVLFELLTGEPPFTGDSPVAVAYQHVREAPRPPSALNPNVIPALDAIVLKAMAKGAANRYQSAAEMRGDLVRVLSGQRPSAPAVMTEEDRTSIMNQSRPTEVVTGRHRPSAVTSTGVGLDADDDDEAERRAKRKKNLTIALIVVLCLAVLGLVAWITSGLLSNNNPQNNADNKVTVPNVISKTEAAARGDLSSLGLTPVITPVPCQAGPDGKAPCTSDQVGNVIEVDPAVGTSVDKGSTVTIKVGRSPDQVAVPDLKGLTITQAQNKLAEVGLKMSSNTTKEETEDSSLIDKVIDSQPPANQKVDPGIEITVTLGKAQEKVTLNDYTGQTYESAKSSLEAAGFTVQRQDVDGTQPQGQVVGQSPKAGRVAKGTQVTLQVSKGNKFEMPDLSGMTEEQAQSEMVGKGWTGSFNVQQTPVLDVRENGKIQEHTPRAGSSISKTDTITIEVGRFDPTGGSSPPNIGGGNR